MEHSSPVLSYCNAPAGEAPCARTAVMSSERTPPATVSVAARDHDTVACKGSGWPIGLDTSAASVATIWLICYLVIGLGWAAARLHLDTLFTTVKIAIAH